MSGHWWRAYDEAVDDPKLILLTDRQHRTWFNLCCVSSQNAGTLPSLAVLAIKLRMTPDKAKRAVAELVALRLVDSADGSFTMHNWSRRQFKSDTLDPTAADRNRRYRERAKDRNADRNAGRNGDRNGDAPQITDTDPEAETESTPSQSKVKTSNVVRSRSSRTTHAQSEQGRTEGSEARPETTNGTGRYPPEFEDLWREYRVFGNKNTNKGTAFNRWKRLPVDDREACFWGLTRYGAWLSEENRKRLDSGRSQVEVKHLETFIGGRGWDSFMEEPQHATG